MMLLTHMVGQSEKLTKLRNMLNEKRQLYLLAHLDALLDHPFFGEYAL